MRLQPDLAHFRDAARPGTILPVWTEVLGDVDTPVSAFMRLDDGRYSFLLESVEGGERLARYSFLGVAPRKVVRSKGAHITLEEGEQHRARPLQRAETPLDVLREEHTKYEFVPAPGLPRFVGGAVGYLAYDLVRFFERLPEATEDDLDLPDSIMMFTDVLVVFDHVKHRIMVIACPAVENDAEQAYRRAGEAIEETVALLRKPVPATLAPIASPSQTTFRSNFSRDDYLQVVERAKRYVRAGDIIQVVPSQRLECDLTVGPLEVYRALRYINPSPYMYYLSFGDLKIVGSSPEILVTEDGGVVNTRPIAGTAPRGACEEEDRALADGLLADEKERAEHVMLVDLGRNDLGRVCRYGSVQVDEFMIVERYSHVMHLVSNVRGMLREGADQFDVLRACFPAGTVSGAPKIRAMEIIEELEPTRRGPYAGAVGYFSFSGNMDTCITIRTLVIKGQRAYAQAGGGVVADSVPEREYEESLNKARALLRAVEMAEAGLQ